MSRTVTALFETREEAEAARARLASEVKVESTRLLAKDTAAALEGLSIDPKQVKTYRDSLQGGNHLLVATVARGEQPARIIRALTEASDFEAQTDEPSLSYEVGPVAREHRGSGEPKAVPAADIPPPPIPAKTPVADAPSSTAATTTAEVEAAAVPTPAAAPAAVERSAPPAAPNREPIAPRTPVGDPREGLRVGQPRQVPESGPHGERLDIESRAPARRLSEQEVEEGGLLKERMIEVIEMREEPVITKEVVVREEVIVRKTVENRTETIRDTVRSTNVDVDELPPPDSFARPRR
jgi:hypothetical protein